MLIKSKIKEYSMHIHSFVDEIGMQFMRGLTQFFLYLYSLIDIFQAPKFPIISYLFLYNKVNKQIQRIDMAHPPVLFYIIFDLNFNNKYIRFSVFFSTVS